METEMESQEVFLTNDGRKHALSQLELLRTAGRAKVAQYLHDAKESGDVIDNAAYEEAKNEQARLEGRIIELEQLLAKAKLINKARSDVVSLGSIVHLRDSDDCEYHYTLVGSYEAKPSAGLISNESPVGKALLGHKVGDMVFASTSNGVKEFVILDIDGSYQTEILPKPIKNELEQLLIKAITKEIDAISTITVHIMEEPLTAQNFTTIISAITELHTKCWLIKQGRFADLIEYTQTHDTRFTNEANLVITKLTHNSPADIKLDVGMKEIAEALKIGIDSVVQVSLRHEEAKLDNQAKALEMKLKELETLSTLADKAQVRQVEAQKAELENQKSLLDKEKQHLEIEKQQLALQKERLEIEMQRISYALETADKMVDVLHPGIDSQMKAIILRTLLPNLLQLGSTKGLELVLPERKARRRIEDSK